MGADEFGRAAIHFIDGLIHAESATRGRSERTLGRAVERALGQRGPREARTLGTLEAELRNVERDVWPRVQHAHLVRSSAHHQVREPIPVHIHRLHCSSEPAHLTLVTQLRSEKLPTRESLLADICINYLNLYIVLRNTKFFREYNKLQIIA